MGITFTQKQQDLIVLVFQCMEQPVKVSPLPTSTDGVSGIVLTIPQVDTKKLAELGGYKTAASANTAWCNIRNMLAASANASAEGAGAEGEVEGEGDESAVAVAKKGKGKKRKAEEMVSNNYCDAIHTT